MIILRVSMRNEQVSAENMPLSEIYLGGSALIAKILNREVPPLADPLGPENKLIVACGPLAGTKAPQLGRLSLGAKSPLTEGIKEANAGGPAGQYLDRLGIRALIVEDSPQKDNLYCLLIKKGRIDLLPAAEYRGMKNYDLASALQKRFGRQVAIISIGLAGELGYRGAAVSCTDMLGDPSRNAARGGLGAVMGAKGLKAIVIDPSGTGTVPVARPDEFRRVVRNWSSVLKHDVTVSLYHRFGTPFAINNSACHGTLPALNYRTGRPENYSAVSGHKIQQILFTRGGRMHACMPGCLVQCSIIYPDERGGKICSAYEYETIALLGTNLGITDNDQIARLKFQCDDLGLDAIETGSALGLAAEAGKMRWGDAQGALALLREIESATPLGIALGNGVVATARHLGISRVPAYKGLALPAHDPRAVKGTGVTYFSSPLGADHTAGLTYRLPKNKDEQIDNSLSTQIKAAACDAFGYCLNAVPGSVSIYPFFASLMNARYGLSLKDEDIINIAKETLSDQLAFNEKAEFGKKDETIPPFLLQEAVSPTGAVFDVNPEEIKNLWQGLDRFKEREKIREIRIPPLPQMLVGVGVARNMGRKIRELQVKKVFLVTDPYMFRCGRAKEISALLEQSGVATEIFSEVEPDPPIELIEKAGRLYQQARCDAILGLGGGSSLDTAKGVGLRVTHPGEMQEYESIVGGGGKIRPILPPLIAVPTTAGTGSEVNPCAVLTDKARDLKFILMSNHLIPKLAVIDPLLCVTMPPQLTVETGIDALAHCIEGYVSLATAYHPYFESMALYGVKLVGRSLLEAYRHPDNIRARMDMCMAAVCGGLAFLKGLGLGHALTHALGAHYHLPHGRAAIFGLLCFVMANKETCREAFTDMAFLLSRTGDLEGSLRRLYGELGLDLRLKSHGIKKEALKEIAFYTSRDAVNMATDPTSPGIDQILTILTELYD